MMLPADAWEVIASFSSSLSCQNLSLVSMDAYDGVSFNQRRRKELFPKLSCEQLECATSLTSSSTVLKNLAGPPGAGKTYVLLSYILENWIEKEEPISILCRTSSISKWNYLLAFYGVSHRVTVTDMKYYDSLTKACRLVIDDGSFAILNSESRFLVIDGIASCARSASQATVYPCFWLSLNKKIPSVVRKVIFGDIVPHAGEDVIVVKEKDDKKNDDSVNLEAVIIYMDYINSTDKFYHEVLDQENRFLRPFNTHETVYVYYKAKSKEEGIFMNLFLALRDAGCTHPYALSIFMLNRLKIRGTTEEVENTLSLSPLDIARIYHCLKTKEKSTLDPALLPFYKLTKPLSLSS